jgi:predicted acylesterase/phospholipase RssA
VRRDLPFQRLALTLSGGGALGAYEAGVLGVLEQAGVRPQIVLGVSVGAINAVIWLANDMKTAPLVEIWKKLRPSSVGLRWITLAARAAGAFLVVLGTFELLLTLADVPAFGLSARLRSHRLVTGSAWNAILTEAGVWIVLALLGAIVAVMSRRLEDTLAGMTSSDPERLHRWLAWLGLGMLALYVVPALVPIDWPRRAHLVALLLIGLLWLAGRAGRHEGWARRLLLRVLPETGGRGLWRGRALRQLVEEAVAKGPSSPLRPDVNLIISACALDTGRMHHFITERTIPDALRARVSVGLGDVVPLDSVRDVLDATAASSAVPLVFEPVHVRGHEYVDGGVFSNQPLHVALADGADALLIVLVSPSVAPPLRGQEPNVLEIASRIPQIANWRDLQSELRELPPEWSRHGNPARVCVVEPEAALPGSLLGFDPGNAEDLMARGTRDAWRALERSGWLEP